MIWPVGVGLTVARANRGGGVDDDNRQTTARELQGDLFRLPFRALIGGCSSAPRTPARSHRWD